MRPAPASARLLPPNEAAAAIADRVLKELTSADVEDPSTFPPFDH